MSPTRRLYRENVYQTTCQATVLEVLPTQEGDLVLCDQTVFFPEGGGQSSDMGIIALESDKAPASLSWSVVHAFEKEDKVYHRLEAAHGQEPSLPLQKGDTVTLTIDWDHRFENMQRHLGEHILSGAFHRLLSMTNRGFHMGENYVTVDMEMPPEKAHVPLTMDMVGPVEEEANRVIWANYPVTVTYFATKEEAKAMPSRKALAFEEDISMVTVGDKSQPMDCCPCCGTHPAYTGQVGLLKIYKIEKNKSFWRIYFDCGKKALARLGQHYTILSEIAEKRTTAPEKLAANLAAEEARYNEMREQLSALRKVVTNTHVEAIREILTSGNSPLHYEIRDVTAGDFSKAGKQLQKTVTGTLLVSFPEESVLLLFSDGSFDCGQAVKEKAATFGAKGGGSATNARANFATPDALQDYINTLIG